MMPKEKVLAPPVLMSVEERNRVRDYLILLIAIDKRVNAHKVKAKKIRKTTVAKKARQNRGPRFFITKSCIIKVSVATNTTIQPVLYDRHHCFNTHPRYVSDNSA